MSDKIVVIENGCIIKVFDKKDILKNIDFLKEHSIKIPFGVELIHKLKEKGVTLEIQNWEREEIIKKIVDWKIGHK